ncbi:MAG TPA: universal stress protein [Candidatus Binatia bacterium]|nr:universal stress protein [Candidatus Binatia bacterium]
MTILVHVNPVGAVIAFAVLLSVTLTLWWMLHPPRSRADIAARAAEQTLKHLVGAIIVVFSSEIHSEHMMALAARIAKGQRADVLAAYVVEVPFMLPANATMEVEDRTALDVLAAAEAIAQKYGTSIRTTTIHHRQTAQAVLDLAKGEQAHLIVMGSFREGKYSGAPLGRAIEQIAAHAKCDVLIGVEGEHGTVLTTTGEARAELTSP